MDVRSSFRQTEVGLIPRDWKVAQLQQVCREAITYGIVQCGPHIGNGVPYIRVSDMDARELDIGGMLRTSPAIASKFIRSTVQEGDVVYALRGKLGEVRQITGVVAGANLTQGTARLSPRNGIIRSQYLLWTMRSPRVLRQAELAAKGTTFREITLADLRRIAIAIPSPSEQEAIADALSDADALIESLERLIAKKRDLKQGAIQDLLTGKKRLPGFNEELGYKQTEVGLIPVDWAAEELGSRVLINSGESPSHFHFKREGIPYFKVEQLNTGNKYQVETPYFFDGTKKVAQGSLIFPKRGASILLNKIRILTEDSFMDTNLMTLTPREGLHGEYLYYALLHIQLWRFADTTSIPQINNKHINPLVIPLPPFPEQRAIAEVLSDIDSEIAALEEKFAKACNVKQGMMQELLTGRTRLL